MSQRWEDLVMAHYAEDPKVIESSLPDDLLVDTFEGRAWFSVVAFRLTNLRIQPFTFLPWQDFWKSICVLMSWIRRGIAVCGFIPWIPLICLGYLELVCFMAFVTTLPVFTGQVMDLIKN